MNVKTNTLAILLLAQALALPAADTGKKRDTAKEETSVAGTPGLWRNPADLASRNLFYGPGGEAHVPKGTFKFIKEDLDGTNPKFVVEDQSGVKWKVKLGLESRPESVSSRLVWAVGYFANEDYFVPTLAVQGMPARLHRGWRLVDPDGSVHNVRLKREEKGEKKLGTWDWRHDALTGTRELNGLKAVMALINNWDLKPENNAIYQNGSERLYMVSDLGATFGSAGRTWPREKAKDNFDVYSRSVFIRRVTADTVDFEDPARPRWVFLINPKEYLSRVCLESIGKNIPRTDVRWMGELLARLSPEQIRDAFSASGYSPQETEAFAGVVERRIAELKRL